MRAYNFLLVDQSSPVVIVNVEEAVVITWFSIFFYVSIRSGDIRDQSL